jgi:hypothetical protein
VDDPTVAIITAGATVIGAVIGATASVAAALITTRARIATPTTNAVLDKTKPNKGGNPQTKQAPPEKEASVPVRYSTHIIRNIRWVLVAALYLMSVYFLGLFGLFLVLKTPMMPLDSYLLGYGSLVGAALFGLIGMWAQMRLRRRSL